MTQRRQASGCCRGLIDSPVPLRSLDVAIALQVENADEYPHEKSLIVDELEVKRPVPGNR